jgi:hypothetical protein
MKKILTLLFFIPLFLATTVWAQPEKEKKWAIGVLSGLYFMQDEVFQESYGKSALFLGAEIPFRLPLKSFKNLVGVFNFRSMNDKGNTSLTEEEIKLNLIFFSLSLRYVMNFNKFRPFLGPGIDYILYKEKYPETFPVESMNGSTFGFHLQGGSYYHFSSSLSAIIYFKYNMAEALEEEVKVNLGGTEWGVGLVYYF